MTLILLHKPVPGTPVDSGLDRDRFERVHMFPGRHLGEEEFDREQAYADLRLASVLRGRPAGIVTGLDVSPEPKGIDDDSIERDSIGVNAGLALDGSGRVVSLNYPLRVEWQELIGNWRKANAMADAGGVYYLMLQRDTGEVDAGDATPCQRLELDPTRDSRRVVTATLVLRRLNVNANDTRELVENWVAADRVDGGFMAGLGPAVPLALLAIGPKDGGFELLWLSVEAGRYEAVPDSGYRVLLNQTSAALRRVMQAALSPDNVATPLADFLEDNLKLDFLPAAGQLPLEWLRNPAAPAPGLLWLAPHLGIDMVPVPEEAVPELLTRHIARRVIDLRRPAGDKLRLLLAVNEPDYRGNLLDIPQTDVQLESDLYRFFMRAHEAWRKWKEQFDRLFYVEPSKTLPLTDPDEAALEKKVLDPGQFKKVLGLPDPEPRPELPTKIFEAVISRADADLEPSLPGVPYPFNKGVPPAPAFYQAWLDGGNPPAEPKPSDDGLVVQYAVALVELEAVENQIRAQRTRVEKTRDLLLLMRQQLDSQTVALAALAGGVAGDGSGLKVARLLPYANLDVPNDAPSAVAAPAGISTATMFQAVGASGSGTAALATTGSGFGGSLLKTALATTAAKSNILLASRPQSFSAFELGINKTRLDLLSRITREAVAKPAFEAKEYRFGVIDHVSPEVNEYAKAYFGMKELLATLKDLFDPTDGTSLRAQMLKAGRVDEAGEGPGDLSPFERSGRLESPELLDNLATKNAGEDAKKRALLLSQYRYHALFKAGRILTQWIAICETRYNTLERKLQGKLREQAAKTARIDKLAGLIRVARETLENLDRFRIEQLGDYGVAQRLLDEDWRRVYAVNQERTRILTTALRGLYYVRVRSTPVSAGLADPLLLRYGSSRDIVPGCDWEEDVDLPDAIEPFFTTVCEIPMDDWARLRPLRLKLPPFHLFDYLGQIRQSRFKARPALMPVTAGGDSLQARLQTVLLQNRSVLQQWAAYTLPVFTSSSLQTQAEAARVLSLEDLSLGSGPLRKEAQELRDQLEHCAHCLLEKLNLLPGSIRLQWGQLAEDDRIRVEDVSWWPGLEQAEADDFNATRTVAELISWLFRQQAPDASANSRSALRNLVRALLIHASLGDPREIVRGNVFVPPRFARVGEQLQVKLSRAPSPGTRLQLLDPEQRLVALLAVEDHTPTGTRVSITDLVQPGISINTRFSVVANKRTQEKL